MNNSSNFNVLGYLVAVILLGCLVIAFALGHSIASTSSNAANLCDKQGYFQVDQKRYKCEEVK